MKLQVLLVIAFFSVIYGKKLSLDHVISDSPFKVASLGWYIPIPNENSILIRGKEDRWKEWFKVDLIHNDTILLIDSSDFRWKGDDIFVNTLSFSKNGKKIIIGEDKEKLWRHKY